MLEMVVPEQVKKISPQNFSRQNLLKTKIGYSGRDGEPALHLRHGGRGAVLRQVVQGEMTQP